MRKPSRRMFAGGALVAAAVIAATAATAHVVDSLRASRTSSPGTVSAATPVRAVAAPRTLVDATGHEWQPDAPYATGGALATSRTHVLRSASWWLYQHSRVGPTGYAFPVAAPGTYFVDLFVAETAGARPGARVWDVSAEGRPAVSSVDVAAEAGPDRAWHVVFATPVTDGVLDLAVNARVGTPRVDAVEVAYQGPQTSRTTLFGDDFAGPAGASPDRSKWGYDVGGGGWGNGELETYTARPDNASMDGLGDLSITARRERHTGLDGITRDYTSARLTTAGTFAFRYGTVQARIRLPAGTGLWPALWAVGNNVGTVGWPRCGEIDVMENVGSAPNTAYGTIHGINAHGSAWSVGHRAVSNVPLSSGYHTFGLVWGPDAVATTLDGRTYMTVAAADLPAVYTWGLNHSFHLLLNLAVGGTLPGPPGASTPFPAVMSVDFVHVTT